MRARRDDGRGLRRAECGSNRRLLEIVKARRPAADLTVRYLAEGQSFNRAEQATRRGAYPLSVCEVTGIVIGRDHRLRQAKRRDKSDLVEQLRHIAYASGERRGGGFL